jgi:hypothetical protein
MLLFRPRALRIMRSQSRLLTLFLIGLVLSQVAIAQPNLNVQVQRWLQVQSLSGQVRLILSNTRQSAKVSDRLSAVGDGITTGRQSAAQLALDSGIGFVDVAEQTQVIIQEIVVTANQGRVTRLAVPTGRAKLKLRRFTNPESRLEIQTPAGVSGVRGTEFGINVQPDGKTSVAVLDGRVDSSAQSKTVEINRGFQSFTMKGEPPSDPVPLKDDPGLTYKLDRQIVRGIRRLKLKGQVDVVNAVFVGGEPVLVDRHGQFEFDVVATSHPRLTVAVVTPLGKSQTYDLKLL